MLVRKFSIVLSIIATLIANGVVAADSGGGDASKTPIFRSRSGGSGMVDTMRKPEIRTNSQRSVDDQGVKLGENDRARISDQALAEAAANNEDSKYSRRRVPLSRSGGSASATFANVPG